jgi:RHS repeat-associated protein
LDSRLPSARPFIYTHAANSNLVSQITTPTGLQENKAYDTLGRLVSISALNPASTLNPQPSAINSFSYTYDAAGQRIQETALDYQQNFSYDAQRELTQATPATPTTQRPAYTYAYDGIGNRQTVERVIPNAPTDTFTFTTNSVNQYTAITKQPALSGVEGTTVNPSYDANGNTLALQRLGGGGGMTLRYDEENRLVEASNSTSDSVYTYDGLGRRVEAKVSSWNLTLGTWNLVSDTHYVYDGRRVVEELDANYTTLRSYTRGLDLSGSLEGAGGIGGLLALSLPNGLAFTAANYFYDGNGNVIDLVGDDGSEQAHYQYSPFGERLSATGALADINPYQFSSKERNLTTGFYYYGLRYYNPGPGRWLGRDPLGEKGGINLYCFVGNGPYTNYDSFGLEECTQDNCHRIAVKHEIGAYFGFGISGSIEGYGEKCNCCPCGAQSVEVGVSFEAQVGTGIGGEFGPIKLELKGPQLGGGYSLAYVKDCDKDHGSVHWEYKASGVFGYEASAELGVGISGSISIKYEVELGLEVSSSGARGYFTYGYDVSEDYTVSGGPLEATTTKHLAQHEHDATFAEISW